MPGPALSRIVLPTMCTSSAGLAAVVRLEVDPCRRLAGRRVADALDRVALDAQADHAVAEIALRPAPLSVESRIEMPRAYELPFARPLIVTSSFGAPPMSRRLSVTRWPKIATPNIDWPSGTTIRRFLIVTSTGAGFVGLRAVDEEHGARRDRVAVGRAQTDRAEPERDDARAVGGDRRVVVRHPEPAGRVALAFGKLRQEDRPAAPVEAALQPGGVVAGACGSDRVLRRRARERACAARQNRPAAVATEDVTGEHDLALAGDNDATAELRQGRTRIAEHLIPRDLDSGREHGRAVRRIEVDVDARSTVVGDDVADDVRVDHGLAAIGRDDVDTRTRAASHRVAFDAQPDRPESSDDVALGAAERAVRQRNALDRAARARDAAADQHRVERRAADGETAQRHLVSLERDPVHPLRPRDGDAKPADADARRNGCADARMRDVEDSVRVVRSLGAGRIEPGRAASQCDDAGPV